MKSKFVFLVLLAGLWQPLIMAEEKLRVYTVNYPLQYFAQRIAANHASVHFPAPADADPAYWTPDRDVVAEYQAADLVLLNGAGYAKWIDRVSLPRASQVDTSAVFSSDYIHFKDRVTHTHGRAGDHSHAGIASITWLDFHQAIAQAETIMKALSARRPQYREVFENNFNVLKQDLSSLDLAMQKTVAVAPDKPLLASHPVYHYLARRYALKMQDMHWEPGEYPDDAQWQKLRGVTEDFPALWMVWEKPPLGETEAHLKTLYIDTLVFDPCESRPPTGDFLDVMRGNISDLGRAYRQDLPD